MAYLQKLRRQYYAVLHVPPDVRKHFGKLKFKQSLKTESKSHAERLVGPVIACWKEQIRLARGQDDIAAEAAVYRDMIRKAPNARAKRQIMAQLEARADDIWQSGARPYEMNPDEARDDSPTWPDAKRLWTLATREVVEIAPLVESWLSESHASPRTKDLYRSALRLLIKHHPTAQEVTRKAASTFVRDILAVGRRPSTVNRMIAPYSAF